MIALRNLATTMLVGLSLGNAPNLRPSTVRFVGRVDVRFGPRSAWIAAAGLDPAA